MTTANGQVYLSTRTRRTVSDADKKQIPARCGKQMTIVTLSAMSCSKSRVLQPYQHKISDPEARCGCVGAILIKMHVGCGPCTWTTRIVCRVTVRCWDQHENRILWLSARGFNLDTANGHLASVSKAPIRPGETRRFCYTLCVGRRSINLTSFFSLL